MDYCSLYLLNGERDRRRLFDTELTGPNVIRPFGIMIRIIDEYMLRGIPSDTQFNRRLERLYKRHVPPETCIHPTHESNGLINDAQLLMLDMDIERPSFQRISVTYMCPVKGTSLKM